MKLLILAGCIALTSALPALLGSDHCTYGPSYWCSHVQHARECGAMKHCMSTVWTYSSQPVKSDAKCEVCVFGVTEARKLLKDHATQEQITAFLEKGCEMVPEQKLKDECLNIVKEYLPEILQLLASDVDPKVVCSIIGMCTQDLTQPETNDVETTTKGPSDLCKDCEKLFQDFEKMLKDNQTEGQLEATLDVLCEQLGPLKDECKSLIAEYLPVVLDLLSTEFNPGTVCRMLGMCKSGNVKDAIEFRAKLLALIKQTPVPNKIRSPVGCEICTQVMKELQSLDRDAKTQQAIEDFVFENVCDLFGQFKTQCQNLVKDYAPMLFEYLANELDPSVACKAFHMCTQASAPKSRVTSLTVVKSEPTLFKTKPHPKTAKSLGSPECVLCEFVIKELDAVLSQNSSREEVTKALEEICSRLPDTISKECKDFVDEYAPAVIELLVSDLDPARLCTLLGLCSGQTHSSAGHAEVQKTDFCELCQLIVQYVESFLEKNATEDEIRKLLEKICNFLPGDLKDECDALVKQYIDVLVKLIAQLANPLEVCEELKLCGNATEAHPAVKQINNLLQRAKTDNTLYYMNSGILAECIQGPEVWCKDESTAAKCGAHAVAYCRRHVWRR